MIRESNVYVCVEKDLWGASVFTTETHHVVSLFLFSPHTLSLLLFPYLLYLAAQREKLFAAENSFLPAAASRELISVLDRREFFQVLKVFSLLSSLIFFKREREKAKGQARNVIVWYEALSFQWRSQCGVDEIITIQSVEYVRVQLLTNDFVVISQNYDITLWRALNKPLWFRQFNFYHLRLLTRTSTIRLAKIACNRGRWERKIREIMVKNLSYIYQWRRLIQRHYSKIYSCTFYEDNGKEREREPAIFSFFSRCNGCRCVDL